jgi:hypothetical protein
MIGYLGVTFHKIVICLGIIIQLLLTKSTSPHSSLNKRNHDALTYHRIKYMIAAKFLVYYWIDGKNNPADIVLGYQQVNSDESCSNLYCFALVIHSI